MRINNLIQLRFKTHFAPTLLPFSLILSSQGHKQMIGQRYGKKNKQQKDLIPKYFSFTGSGRVFLICTYLG